MPAVALDDREQIAGFLRRNPRAHAYELGDLDDFEWPHTVWFGWESAGRLEQVTLLYTEPRIPVLIAIAEPPQRSMGELLAAITWSLPSVLYTHATPGLLDTLAERYVIEDAEPHLRFALERTDLLDRHALETEILTPEELDEVRAFYTKAYPGTWFVPRMLTTGRYVGVRENGLLACIAGVHVHSPTWRVAALGNVATLPELRGRGLARGACASLCRLLLDDGIETIALNVRANNEAAIASYARLGFAPVAEYVEASLLARTVGG
ncbi:GNAT family N-acetyltransferase [Gaiella sp.]|uniref:GNAT family N-acetyltransferase n=1 Tax=Gaiella sp. TaxID=2663207 RepID=UPI003266AA8B